MKPAANDRYTPERSKGSDRGSVIAAEFAHHEHELRNRLCEVYAAQMRGDVAFLNAVRDRIHSLSLLSEVFLGLAVELPVSAVPVEEATA